MGCCPFVGLRSTIGVSKWSSPDPRAFGVLGRSWGDSAWISVGVDALVVNLDAICESDVPLLMVSIVAASNMAVSWSIRLDAGVCAITGFAFVWSVREKHVPFSS
jgi:hypothetical protein